MSDTQPMQADGEGTRRNAPDGNGEVTSRRGEDQPGESGGGAYPNPHTGKEGSDTGPGAAMGHGGQSEIAYHGPGQLGDEQLDEQPNAATRER